MNKLIFILIGIILSFNTYAKDDFSYIASRIDNQKLFTQIGGEEEDGHIAGWWIDKNSITKNKGMKLYSIFFVYTEDNYSNVSLTITKYKIDCQNQSQAKLNSVTKIYDNRRLVNSTEEKFSDKSFEDIPSQSPSWNAYRFVCQGLKPIK